MTKDGSNTAAPRILPFPQVVDRLPEACWHRRHAGRFAESLVLWLEGDGQLAGLDLDAVLGMPEEARGQNEDAWQQQQNILLVLATGDLTVTGAIHSANTDGSTGLVVLGDLKAAHVLVGGQEIYVRGRLKVEGLFWGDYNHGSITVEGRTEAQFWLATDEYHCKLEGGLAVSGAHWDDDSYDAMPPPLCRANLLPWFPSELIHADCAPDDRLNSWLWRGEFIDAAREGKPLLAPRPPRLARPPRMDSDAITTINLQRLLQTPLHEGIPRKRLGQMGTDPYFRLNFPTDGFLGGVYIETGNHRYLAKLERVEPGTLGRMIGRKAGPELRVKYTDEAGEEPSWRHLSTAEIEADTVLQATWREWLPVIAEAEPIWQQLVQHVTVERLESLLDLPFVQADFDGYNDDHEYGPYTLAVRQANEGTPKLSLGWMGSDQRDEDGDPYYCWAHFEIETREDGHKQAAIDFQPGSATGGKLYDARFYLRRLPRIWQAFQAIETILATGQAAKVQADAEQAQTVDARRRARWETHALPGDGWLDVPLRDTEDHPHPPTQRFRLATPYEVQQEIEAFRFAGQQVAFIDHHLDADETSYFLVMDEDCALPCLELDTTVGDIAIAGVLFRGNLTLESHLLYFDKDVSPLFIVKGNLTARHLGMAGNLFYIGGDLRCECLYGVYNHGELVVAGALHAEIVIAKDFSIRASQLYSRALLHSDDIQSFNAVRDGEGNTFHRLDGFPCTCRVTDILPSELCSSAMYWGMYFPDEWALLQRFRNGEQVVVPPPLDSLFTELPEVLPQVFDWVFASPRLAGGKLVVRDGENYDGEDFAFAIANENGERTIGLNRGNGYNFQLFIRQSADGSFEACHWIAPREGEQAVMFSEPVTSTYFSPMAAKHAFYVALERLALLPYRGRLQPDAPAENAASVQADLDALEQYVGGDYEDEDTLAYHLHALLPKLQAFYPPEASEVTQLLEWHTVAYAGNWSAKERAFNYADACVQRVGAYAHRLHDPDRFLRALPKIAVEQNKLLALLERAGELLAAQAGGKALLEIRRRRGYLLHEAGQYADARTLNRALRADAEAQLGREDAWLCPLLINLAQNSYELDDLDDAEACLHRTHEVGRLHGDSWAVDQALFQLGVLSLERGYADVSLGYFEQRFAHAQTIGDRRLMAAAESSLAEWAQRTSGGEGAR